MVVQNILNTFLVKTHYDHTKKPYKHLSMQGFFIFITCENIECTSNNYY